MKFETKFDRISFHFGYRFVFESTNWHLQEGCDAVAVNVMGSEDEIKHDAGRLRT